MIKTHVPLSYYREVLTSITYFIDYVSSSSINFGTPFKALTIEIYASTLLNMPPYIFFLCCIFTPAKAQSQQVDSARIAMCFPLACQSSKGTLISSSSSLINVYHNKYIFFL
jgi:hypothetical protein